jgi:hypothetical protein
MNVNVTHCAGALAGTYEFIILIVLLLSKAYSAYFLIAGAIL